MTTLKEHTVDLQQSANRIDDLEELVAKQESELIELRYELVLEVAGKKMLRKLLKEALDITGSGTRRREHWSKSAPGTNSSILELLKESKPIATKDMDWTVGHERGAPFNM